MTVYRVTNPNAFGFEPLVNLIGKAVLTLGLGELKEILLDLARNAANPKVGIFVGVDDKEEIKCFLVAFLPANSFVEQPQLYGGYNLGPPKLWKETFQEAVKFTKAAGYNSIWAINGSGKSDKVYARALGFEPKPVRSVLEYKIK